MTRLNTGIFRAPEITDEFMKAAKARRGKSRPNHPLGEWPNSLSKRRDMRLPRMGRARANCSRRAGVHSCFYASGLKRIAEGERRPGRYVFGPELEDAKRV